jgi:hypothetical protein
MVKKKLNKPHARERWREIERNREGEMNREREMNREK